MICPIIKIFRSNPFLFSFTFSPAFATRFFVFFVILSEVEISKKKQKELKHVAQSGLEIGFGFIFTFLNDKHLKFLSLAKPRLGFSTVSLYTFLMKNYGTIPSK